MFLRGGVANCASGSDCSIDVTLADESDTGDAGESSRASYSAWYSDVDKLKWDYDAGAAQKVDVRD